jgi:SAM-dependent methyltransferase
VAARYRTMEDSSYLDQEEGRRHTARALLAAVAAQRPTGRLLDVGCGHGLLLDEARARGYEVSGVEPSASASAYARDVLGLDVRTGSLEELVGGEFDVITLVDVLEHLADPLAAIEECRSRLAGDGLLCVVTPDPSSLTARLAGRRWWGLIPGHSYLVPYRVLLELITAAGFTIAEERHFVRRFTLSYWIAGLTERTPAWLARLTQPIEPVLARRSLSLSLGDERAVLAVRSTVREPARTLATDRGHSKKVHVVLPAYNAAATVPEVASSLPTGVVDRALLVDDASRDETVSIALAHGFQVIVHPTNRGYGANQKTCYVRAIRDGADVVVMVHADGQYDPALVSQMVAPILERRADVVIGSRMLDDKTIAGGMPRWKWVGNKLLTAIENRAFRTSFSEFHTGYRAFSVPFLSSIAFLRNSDGFVFDQQIFAQIIASGGRVVEIPIPTRYFVHASSVSLRASVAYGLRTLWVVARFRADRGRRRWSLLRRPTAAFADVTGGETSELVR